ncbi:CNNM domain-containing protein [Fulvivirgaceae bacterium BMA10]|uniref:CNNM domain-containing protein n=1 Tax=Splendidivirga corallicola TaxID=3051826 RepID=A0ABT8KT32_9BACT|nr:CNNM domain-containing protein [Fulvivirgaceae bacterium BMA10]
MNYVIVIFLVLLAGTFAGLTLALFSLNLTELERKIRIGNKEAEKVYTIRKKGNLLLCTLLLGNVASYTSMAVFLGSITGGVVAGITATALIFIFGEILPQAVFPRFALYIGARTSWLVKIFMVLFYPVAAPIAWILDKILGEELPVIWSKKELKEIIKYHEDSIKSPIDKDEEKIVLGALSFSDKRVRDVMIPAMEVYQISAVSLINERLLQEIKDKDFSRIPVYFQRHDNIIGVLLVKNLIGVDSTKRLMVQDLQTEQVIRVNINKKLDDLFNMFINQRMQIALVYNSRKQYVGIVTLEDILEEILRTEIEELA